MRRAKETERLAKLEQKRLEKEARDRERAEQQAREQARRGVEREKARLAKRYPLPDEVGACSFVGGWGARRGERAPSGVLGWVGFACRARVDWRRNPVQDGRGFG